jgi:hypothetical protein
MAYRNWERKERQEDTVENIRDREGTGYIIVYKENKAVKMNRREILVHYDAEKDMKREKPFTVYLVDGNGRKNEQLSFRDKEEAEDFVKGMLRDVTENPQYRADLAEKLEFEMIKGGLAEKEEVVESTTIKWDSSNRSDVIEKYFHSDEDYVMESVEESGAYSEAVGQGLRARVTAK